MGDAVYRRNTIHLKRTKAKFHDKSIISSGENTTNQPTNNDMAVDSKVPGSQTPPIEPENVPTSSSAPIQTRSGRISKPVDRFDPSKY